MEGSPRTCLRKVKTTLTPYYNYYHYYRRKSAPEKQRSNWSQQRTSKRWSMPTSYIVEILPLLSTHVIVYCALCCSRDVFLVDTETHPRWYDEKQPHESERYSHNAEAGTPFFIKEIFNYLNIIPISKDGRSGELKK